MTPQIYNELVESETETCDSDDSRDDPNFDVLENTRSKLSNLSIKKKSRSRVSVKLDEEADCAETFAAPEFDANDEKSFEIVHKIIEGGQVEKLKVEQCKIYLRKYGLRLTGKKDILIQRIKEHISIMNGEGEHKYPASSFVMNCKGDACAGDVVIFEQNVYEMFNIASRSASGPPCGQRIVAGRIVKESYGAAKQQHTFTIEVLWSKGHKPLPPLHPLLIKGRNLYKLKTVRQRWEDESERQKILSEKHARGNAARTNRDARLRGKEIKKALRASKGEVMNGKQEMKRNDFNSSTSFQHTCAPLGQEQEIKKPLRAIKGEVMNGKQEMKRNTDAPSGHKNHGVPSTENTHPNRFEVEQNTRGFYSSRSSQRDDYGKHEVKRNTGSPLGHKNHGASPTENTHPNRFEVEQNTRRFYGSRSFQRDDYGHLQLQQVINNGYLLPRGHYHNNHHGTPTNRLRVERSDYDGAQNGYGSTNKSPNRFEVEQNTRGFYGSRSFQRGDYGHLQQVINNGYLLPRGHYHNNHHGTPTNRLRVERRDYDGAQNGYGLHHQVVNNSYFPRDRYQGKKQQLCRYYDAQGRCHYGTNCKYLH